MGKLIEPRILGFNPVDADTSALFVADKDNNEYKVFDSEGELYTPDGGVVSDRLDALEAGIPPIDDARIVVLEGAKAQNDLDVADLQGRMTTAESDIDAVEVTVADEQLLLDQAQTDIVNLQGDMVTAQADIVTAKGVADATTIVANAHVARTDNPHAVTALQVGADATGTASAAVAAHVAAADPHAQYLKENATASEVEVLPLNDANNYFSTSTLGEQMQEAGAHMASTANPHSVTAAQVGLGNVTNESKATMFTNAALTGSPTAPTAADGDNDTSIATTAFTTKAVSNHNSSASAHGLNVAATVGALPIPDAGGYYSTDTINGAFQSVGAQLAQTASLAQLNEKTSYGVVSGLGVTQQTVPDMTVRVETGIIWMAAGTRFAPTADNALAITEANATNPRIDIVYVNASGAIAYLAGTAAATPAQPATPAGGQLLATILVTAGKTSILTADIVDRRKNMWTEAWIQPTLLNGATNSGRPFQYCKSVSGLLMFRGEINNVPASGTPFAALLAGYRPVTNMAIICSGNGAFARATILTNGNIQMSAGTFSSYANFEGVSVPTT